MIWAGAGYLFIIPSFYSKDQSFTLTLWAYEGIVLAIVYVLGSFHCLRNCTVDPKKHFLVDFGCLYAPVSLTTLAIVWVAYHTVVGTLSLITAHGTAVHPAWILRFLYSDRFLDVLRVVCVTGSTAAVFYRIGMTMGKISEVRGSTRLSDQPR